MAKLVWQGYIRGIWKHWDTENGESKARDTEDFWVDNLHQYTEHEIPEDVTVTAVWATRDEWIVSLYSREGVYRLYPSYIMRNTGSDSHIMLTHVYAVHTNFLRWRKKTRNFSRIYSLFLPSLTSRQRGHLRMQCNENFNITQLCINPSRHISFR